MPFGEAISQVIGEFIGTFLFVLIIPLASLGIGTLAPIPISFMLMAMIFSFADASGAHFNPAITLANFILGKMAKLQFVRYVLAQIVAGLCAALYATTIVGLDFPVPMTDFDLLGLWQAFAAELIFTFGIVTVMLHVSCSRQKNNEIYAFSMGMIVLAASFSVGGFTSGAFNPAVVTGIQLVRCITGDCSALRTVWLYWAASMGGAVIAAICYRLLDTEDEDDASTAAGATSRLEDIH